MTDRLEFPIPSSSQNLQPHIKRIKG